MKQPEPARKYSWRGIFAGLCGITLLAIVYFAARGYWLGPMFIAGAACVFLLLWFVPELQLRAVPDLTTKERFDRENEARKTLAQIVAGLVVVISLYSATKTFQTSQDQLAATRDGQITDRFIKAIDELEATDEDRNPLFVRRLGGIYALERIAAESERDHWPIPAEGKSSRR